MLVFSLLLACGGGATPEPPKDAPTAPTEAPRPTVGGDLVCPEGTTQQSASSSKGEERWCDRAGVMHGPYLRLYPDGSRAVRGEYDNSSPNADWVWWHENGQEASKGKYIKGRQTGPWTWWHPNGTRAEEGDFLGGRKAGQWVKYYESGHKKEEGIYHNDMKNGMWTYYLDDEESTVEKTERWEGGVMVEEKILAGPALEESKAKAKKGK